MKAPRLDEWLVENNHYPTRAKARDAILRGCITFKDNLEAKPSRKVSNPDLVTINDPNLKLVSRAGLKLKAALEHTGYSPNGKIALDLGASTGGFCQVLLNEGARHVYAIDVGHGQLDASLVSHPALTNHEKLNCRDLKLEHCDSNAPQFITSDVSFISLKLALPSALEIADKGAVGIFLIKPHFEVGKQGLGKGGIVRDETLLVETAQSVADWLNNFPGWSVTHFMSSPIAGGDGNKEFLMAGLKNE